MSKQCTKNTIRSIVSDKCVKSNQYMGELMKTIRKSLSPQIKYIKNLSSDIKRSLIWYTNGYNFQDFNINLRFDNPLTAEQTYHLNNITKAFSNVPPLNNPIMVYRYTSVKNAIKTDKAFTSVSMSSRVALKISREPQNEKRKCCILNILVPSGIKVLPLFAISDLKWELEVLIDRYTELINLGKNSHGMYNIVLLPRVAEISNILTEPTEDEIFDFDSLPDDKDGASLFYNKNPNISSRLLKKLYHQYTRQMIKKNPRVPKASKDSLRIMTYNVHNGFMNVEETASVYDEILDIIHEVDPDILCLQEVELSPEIRRDFIKDMKSMNYLNTSTCKAEGFFRNDIFIKSSPKLEDTILNSSSINLGRDPENDEKRCASCIEIDNIDLSLRKLKVANVHLDVWDESEKTRVKQITKVLDTFPDIIVGDFNATREMDYSKKHLIWLINNQAAQHSSLKFNTIKTIQDNHYQDVSELKGKRFPVTVWTGRRTDYIFVSPKIKVKQCFCVYTDYSDHYPIVADVM